MRSVLYWTLLCCLRLQGGHEEGSRPLDKTTSVESLARGEEETPSISNTEDESDSETPSMSNTEDESDSASDSEGEDAPTPALTVQRKKCHSPLLPPAQCETLNSLNPLPKDGSPKPVPPPVPPKPMFALNPTAQQANLKVCVRLYFWLDT